MARALATIGLVLLAVPASAQRWTAGFQGGATSGGFTNLPDFTFSGVSGVGGAFINARLNDWFSLQLEGMPQKRTGVSSVVASTLTLSMRYVDFPLLMRFDFPSFAGVTPVGIAGPVLSVKQDCSLDFQGGTFHTVNSCGTDVGIEQKRIDIGALGGAGLAASLGTLELRLEGRFTQGLGNFLSLGDAKSQSYGWSAVMGFSFPFSFARGSRDGTVATRPVDVVQAPTRNTTLVPLEPVPTEMIITPGTIMDAPGAPTVTRRVNVSAVDADVRSVLSALALEAGVSLIIDPEVRRRVTITLTDVPADVALRAVMAAAGLSFTPRALTSPWSSVVFLQPAVNVNQASATAIAARFDVSVDLAKVIVDSRQPFSKP